MEICGSVAGAVASAAVGCGAITIATGTIVICPQIIAGVALYAAANTTFRLLVPRLWSLLFG